ncbi:hypothetical protein LCGC14_1338040, partial [marine sediment metagenome]
VRRHCVTQHPAHFICYICLLSNRNQAREKLKLTSTARSIQSGQHSIPTTIRLIKHRPTRHHTIIVTVSLIPVSDSELAYVARLIRIFRVLRMVSVIPELRHLLNSLLKALPQLGYVALMMFIIVYIFAAIGTTLFAGINEFLWGDIAVSMLTLFRVMTFEDWTDVMYETMEVYPLSWIFYLVFIFLNTFAFLNMLIGIVVNVMEQERAEAYKEAHKNDVTIEDLSAQIAELKQIITAK